MFHREFAPKLAAIRDDAPAAHDFLVVDDDCTSTADRRSARSARSSTKRRSRPRRPARDFGAALGGRPLHPLHGRHDGQAEGRACGAPRTSSSARSGGGGDLGGEPITTPEDITGGPRRAGRRCQPACPFMHGTAHWFAFNTLYRRRHRRASLPTAPVRPGAPLGARRPRAGHLPRDRRRRVRPPAGRGDRPTMEPVARRLAAQRRALGRRDPVAGGQGERWVEQLPATILIDGFGSSETGGQGSDGQRSAAGSRSGPPALPRRTPRRPCSTTTSRPAPVGVVGKLARRGRRPARVLQGPREDRRHVPRRRRRALVGAGRPRPPRGGRQHHRARARLGVDQHRRREGVPRGGRGGAEVARRRCSTPSSSACPTTDGVSASSRSSQLRRGRHRARSTSSSSTSARTSPATRCRASSCWSTRSCARRRASPTTAGRASASGWPDGDERAA